MKKQILTIAMALSLPLSAIYAQGEMDAYKFSQNDLKGTARSMSMGGAFGALGGDISGVAINPAGITAYRTLLFAMTMNLQNTQLQSSSNTGQTDKRKFSFSFDNLGLYGALPIGNDVAPVLNIGFSYNRLKSFDRTFQSYQNGTSSSLTDYMAYRSDLNGASGDGLLLGSGRDPWANNDRLSVLGYNSGLINENPSLKYKSALPGMKTDNSLLQQEKGYISSYDLSAGTTFADVVSFGLSLSVTDINYRLYSSYDEVFNGSNYGYNLQNWMNTDGTGWQVKTGLIFKPVDQFNIGVSYHSPTWYNMTDHSTISLDHDLSGLMNVAGNEITSGYGKGYIDSPEFWYDYKLRTPDKWTFSMAGQIEKLILSADYELTNYKNMKLFKTDGSSLAKGVWDPNGFIKTDFRMASAIRVGAEYPITPRFKARVGYAWMQSPLEKSFKDNKREVVTTGAISNYILDGDINHITYGFGYLFPGGYFIDLAFVMKSQKSDLYAFPNVADYYTAPAKVELKNNTFQGLLTLGFRFN